MNAKLIHAGLILLAVPAAACAPAARAGEMPSLPQVQAVRHVHDCTAPQRLPSQREVGEWTGQHNFAQVYDTRQKLMAEIARSCRQAGIGRVLIVSSAAPSPAEPRRLAVVRPGR